VVDFTGLRFGKASYRTPRPLTFWYRVQYFILLKRVLQVAMAWDLLLASTELGSGHNSGEKGEAKNAEKEA
jgi:hypothetical protein